MTPTRVALLLVVSLLSCQRISPGAARYSCSRELPVEGQCAGGWRCGLDGFCFDPSSASVVTLPCKDPATDCPDGFKCGLEGTCFDPATPTAASLPCKDPATDCPTGFKCGLDARCLSPDVPGPWRCEDTARDCTGGWACGAVGLCFDRVDAGRIACRASVATDCADGWRCGIDGQCQQLDAGFAWPCRVDSDCEASWRCGPAERCVDSAREGLRPNAGMPEGTAFDLGWPAGQPDDLALGTWNTQPSCSGPTDSDAVASGAVRFGSRVELFVARGMGGDLPLGCDGGVPTGEAPILTGHLELGGTPARQLAQYRGTTFVLVDGGILTYTLGPGGQVNAGPTFTGTYERLLPNPSRSCLLAVGPTSVQCFQTDSQTETYASGALRAVDGGVARITDAVIWRYSNTQFIVFAATDQGLFARDVDNVGLPTGGWVHVEWGQDVSVIDELRLAPQPSGSALLQALVREGGGTETLIWTFGITRFNGSTSAGVVTQWGGNYGPVYTQPLLSPGGWYELGWGQSYVACGAGARGWLQVALSAQNPSGVGATRSLHRCPLPDGGAELFQTLNTPLATAGFQAIDVRNELSPLTRGALWVRNDEQSMAMADDRGRIYLASWLGDRLELAPWLLPASPDTVSGRVGRWLMARTEGREYSLGNGLTDAILKEGHFLGQTDAGLAVASQVVATPSSAASTMSRVVASVAGAPELTVYEAVGGIAATYLVELDAYGPLTTDRAGFQVSLPDGGTRPAEVPVYARGPAASPGMRASIAPGGSGRLWYLTRGDQLLVTEVGAALPIFDITTATRNPDLPVARLALPPLPGATLTHVLGLPADPSVGAAYGQALAVAGGRLLHVRANVVGVWRATEQSDELSEIIKAWADGPRVRFGDRRGRVRTFPSRVIVGPELPAGSNTWDFADVCGVTYALSTTGLFRLAATAGVPIGTWEMVPLPPSQRFTTSGSLYSDGTHLLVFDERGLVAEVQGLSCAEPL